MAIVSNAFRTDKLSAHPARGTTWMQLIALVSSVASTSVLALALAPTAAADDVTDLNLAVTAARGGCPALQRDPVLDDVAGRANAETNAYIQHTAKFIPFEDALPVLKGIGYPATNAKLLAGYGITMGQAIEGVTSQGFLVIPTCALSKYGMNTFTSNDGGYSLAAVVMAGN